MEGCFATSYRTFGPIEQHRIMSRLEDRHDDHAEVTARNTERLLTDGCQEDCARLIPWLVRKGILP